MIGASGNIYLNPAPFIKLATGYYYFEFNRKTNWFEAYEACRRINGHLVSFETWEELEAVVRYIRGTTYTDRFWTSGTDYAHHGHYVWFATGKQIDLDIWWPNEPNNFNDAEHCAELSINTQTNQLKGIADVGCVLSRAYICEAEEATTASVAIW